MLVAGVGPGTGAAVVRRFTEGGYDVAMIARDEERLRRLEQEIEHAKAFPVDLTVACAISSAAGPKARRTSARRRRGAATSAPSPASSPPRRKSMAAETYSASDE